MPRLLRLSLLLLAATAATASCGCSGNYILTVPDQVASAGGEAMTVIRLQRTEIALIALGVDDAAMRFKVGDCLERGAYTDKLGYAGTTVPVPATPGKYIMSVQHMDREGDEVAVEAPAYIWEPNRPVVAVDLDSLPASLFSGGTTAPKQTLRRLAQQANIVYLTRRAINEHVHAHQGLAQEGYPDGPILMWQQQRWHMVQEGRYKMPRVVIESRLVSQIPTLCKMFPGLKLGITNSAVAANAFVEAGMKAVVLGDAAISGPNVVRRAGWEQLGDIAP